MSWFRQKTKAMVFWRIHDSQKTFKGNIASENPGKPVAFYYGSAEIWCSLLEAAIFNYVFGR